MRDAGIALGHDTYVIRVPGTWQELPTNPQALRDLVRSNAETNLSVDALESVDFRRFLLVISKLAEQGEQAGLVYLASYIEAVSEELKATDVPDEAAPTTEASRPGLLMASVALMTRRAQDFGSNPITLDAVRAAMEPEPDDASVRRVRKPEVLVLSAGAAVRDLTLRNLHDPRIPESVDVLTVTYHLPIGDGEGLAVLAFQTPCLGLADEFIELFHAIAQTLEFVTA